MVDTVQLEILNLDEGQENAETAINNALAVIDGSIFLIIKGEGPWQPPTSPAEGDIYVIGDGAEGAWVGQDGKIGLYASGWVFLTPAAGWVGYNTDLSKARFYVGTNWNDAPHKEQSHLAKLIDNSGGTSGTGTIAAVTTFPTAADAVATIADQFNQLLQKLYDGDVIAANALVEVVNETEAITEVVVDAMAIIKTITETEAITETTVDILNP